MPYDPFAPVPVAAPPPLPVQATYSGPAPAMTPPTPIADTNALGPIVAPQVDPTMMATVDPAMAVTSTAGPAVDTAHPLSFVNPNGHIADMSGFRAAMQSWRGDRPQFSYDAAADGSRHEQRNDWRGAVDDWRGQRPERQSYMAPGQTSPWGGMVPGVPGSMGTNPNGNPGIVPPPVPAPGAAPITQAGWRNPRPPRL